MLVPKARSFHSAQKESLYLKGGDQAPPDTEELQDFALNIEYEKD